MPTLAVPTHEWILVVVTMILGLLSSLVTPFATAVYGVFHHEPKAKNNEYN
jgi:hypothetical protein